MPFYDAVLFDFGDTLFHRAGGPALLVELARQRGAQVAAARAQALWDEVQLEARTPDALSRGRDLSRDAHDREWLALYSAFDVLGDGLGAALYEHEMAPGGWVPFADTRPTLEALRAAGVEIAVVSNTGWDLRPQFVHAGLDGLVDAWALSYEVGVIKPASEMFVAACASLGVSPDRSLMVGDTALPDGGALVVGMPVLLLPVAPPAGVRGLDVVLRMVGL